MAKGAAAFSMSHILVACPLFATCWCPFDGTSSGQPQLRSRSAPAQLQLQQRPPGQMTGHKTSKANAAASHDPSTRKPHRPTASPSSFSSGSLGACVRLRVCACRLVFVIRGSMSSIKIYLSDFSWFTYIDLGYISISIFISISFSVCAPIGK